MRQGSYYAARVDKGNFNFVSVFLVQNNIADGAII